MSVQEDKLTRIVRVQWEEDEDFVTVTWTWGSSAAGSGINDCSIFGNPQQSLISLTAEEESFSPQISPSSGFEVSGDVFISNPTLSFGPAQFGPAVIGGPDDGGEGTEPATHAVPVRALACGVTLPETPTTVIGEFNVVIPEGLMVTRIEAPPEGEEGQIGDEYEMDEWSVGAFGGIQVIVVFRLVQ